MPDERELTGQEEERLRLALRMIGDEATRPSPAPPRPVAWWRGGRAIGPLVAAAAVVGVIVLGIANGGSGLSDGDAGAGAKSDSKSGADAGSAEDGAGKGQSHQEAIACARMIVEGDVLAVRESSREGRLLVTLQVTEWFKPRSGADQVELDLVDPRVVDSERSLRKGQHLLVYVPLREDLDTNPDIDDEVPSGRKNLRYYLPRSTETVCPPYWKNPR
ncbi:hypothetical protein [Streptomyces apocyni]|uniref:hypothetical protein n=1 Tax=Streptomyces apocyni TaxID=2654677 RepID=UPI0012E9BF66|nr:hypothetical protein [Streptomyces apocyni]